MVSDSGWRRMLYVGAGLAVVTIAIIIAFVIPQIKNNPGMSHKGDLVLIGSQLLIAAILFCKGFRRKREGCWTRILLVFVGAVAILLGLLGLLAISQEYKITLLWKAIRVCAIDDLIIGIIAFTACI
jgi:peptidoglycan/LPS O-acetylase OafA/YrhL